MSILQIKNLTVTLKKDLRTIIDGFNFTLGDGDRAVVIGEEGNGKSTLLKLIFAPELAEQYCEYSGEIITRGTRLGYLPQELTEDAKTIAVADFCAAIPEFYDVSPKELAKLCRDLDLSAEFPFSEQIIGTLSGGERVKLQLLKILIAEPDILLLDEPSNDIDIETLEWLERFINTCGKPVLYVSHDETLIENTANVIIHLEQVRRKTLPRATVAKSGYGDYIESRSRAIDRQERDARREKAELDAKMEKFRQIEQKVEHRQETITRQDPHSGQLLKKKMKAVKSLEKRIDRESEDMTQFPDLEDAIFLRFDAGTMVPNGKTVIEFELAELTNGGAVLARDIKLTVTGAEKVCITGRNGAGKTTLLKAIAAQLLPRADIRCGYMPQDYFDLLPMDKTPVEFLAPSGKKDEVTRAMTMLGSVKYTADEMAHTIFALSGGQKAKLMFLKLISDGCNVLLLDEPTRNFSPMSNPVIRGILREYGGSIISVSHDRRYIAEVCDTVYELTESGLKPRP
ncbi:MAG: ATP-binding cassette domain-containing protein [Oscillospiraceae bacterium]|jgi:ATPase subunit of ABC transporter with duplicated ATPase domains|nr:ATP-binding cassette domain-containing protein [Oscillospiraceae bacterium]